jgi:hypothetical protein
MREHNLAPADELDRFDEFVAEVRREVEVEGKMPVGAPEYNVWGRKPQA